MAIKNLIARGVGFSPGSIKFIPTFGFESGEPISIEANLSVPKLVQRSAIAKSIKDTVVSGIINFSRIIKVVRR